MNGLAIECENDELALEPDGGPSKDRSVSPNNCGMLLECLIDASFCLNIMLHRQNFVFVDLVYAFASALHAIRPEVIS